MTLDSLLESKIKPVNPKGNQLWIFTGRIDDEAEAPTLWPPDAKSQLIGKDPDAGKDWGQEEKRATEDDVLGWHHRFNGHEFEQTPGNSEEQGSLACCSPWGGKESDMTEWTAKTKLNSVISLKTWEEISGEEEKGSICVRTAWIPVRDKLWKS